MIERDFGEAIALDFEQYVSNKENSVVENMEKNFNFISGVDHMN